MGCHSKGSATYVTSGKHKSNGSEAFNGKTQRQLENLNNSLKSVDTSDFYATEELSPQDRYELADALTVTKATKDNFYENSVAFWETTKKPKGEPDHISYNRRTGKISSEYWYTEEGVYRRSDHWGSDVASCSWYIKGRNYAKTGVDKGKKETAFVSWNDIKAKGFIATNTKQDIQNSATLKQRYKGMKIKDKMYYPIGFEFRK